MAELSKATYDVEETAEILGIGRTKAYELVRTGTIEALKFGRSIRIPRKTIEKLLGESVEPEEVPEQAEIPGIPSVVVIKHSARGSDNNLQPVRVAYTLPVTATLKDVMKLVQQDKQEWIEIPVQQAKSGI